MTIENLAALIWRFVGLFALLTALPGIVLLAFTRIGGLPFTLSIAQAIVGVLLMVFSGTLGRLIARGLRDR